MSKPDTIPRQIPCKTRRHREVTIELRKSKKEDQTFKRRNIRNDNLDTQLDGQSPVQLTLDEIIAAMHSEDPERQFVGMQQARRMLSRERNPPIDMMIGHGIVPKCISFLADSNNRMLQFEAAWALTNIASGTTEQTRSIIEHNGVPQFIVLLQSKTSNLVEQAAWALGNIAGDGAAARDFVIQHNVIDGILRLINKSTPISLLRTIVWLMSNLCRNKNPSPPFEQVKLLLPVLSSLLHSKDDQVLTDACWALSYVTDDDNSQIQAVIDTDAVSMLVQLLQRSESNIIVPALRCVGNIVTGTDQQTDVVIAAGGLPKLARLLQHSKVNIVKEAAWTVSNITAGTQKQIQAVLDAGIFHHIRHVLEKGDFKAQKEAAWAVTNTTTSGTQQQVISLIEKYKVLKPFMDLLVNKDARTIKVVQTGLSNMFDLAQKMGSIENFCLMVEELGGLAKLEALLRHENEEVYKKAYAIIDTYYNCDEDVSEHEPVQQAVYGARNGADAGYSF